MFNFDTSYINFPEYITFNCKSFILQLGLCHTIRTSIHNHLIMLVTMHVGLYTVSDIMKVLLWSHQVYL